LVKAVAILGVIKPGTCSCTYTLHFVITAVSHILTHLVELAFRLKSVFENKCRASKWSPFTTLYRISKWNKRHAHVWLWTKDEVEIW